MADFRIDEVTASLLRRATVNGCQLIVPLNPCGTRLDRSDYKRINRALENAGGKWNKRAQAHIFARPAAEVVAELLASGVAVDAGSNRKKQLQAFYTPRDVAMTVAVRANVADARVLEPSAGTGALANACKANGAAAVSCVEIDPVAATSLRLQGYDTICGDFLQLEPEPSFDRVVMNPPFTRGSDAAHIAAAVGWLKPGGLLVSVASSGVAQRPHFARAINAARHHTIEELPPGAFRKAGTLIATCIVTIHR